MTEGRNGRQWFEGWILGGLFGLALLLRGWELGLRPPTPMEAAQAWAAWRGEPLPPGGSPLLAGWNATAFALFGTDDGWMRSGAALAGALTVVALWMLLRPIGLAATVGAAWLWAVSPTALIASRFLDGGIVAAAALAAALAAWRAPHPSRWIGVAAALGIGAAAGPAFWTGCLMLLPMWWLDPPEPAFPRWRALGLFGLTALFAGAWGGWRGSGARETVEGLSAWLAGFAPEGLPLWWSAVPTFLRAEAPIFLLGLTGGILAASRGDRFLLAMMIGAGIGLGLRLVRWSAPFTEHPVLLLPWVVLGAYALQRVWEAVRSQWQGRWVEVTGAAALGWIGLGTAAVWMASSSAMGEARWLVLAGVLGLFGLGLWALGSSLEAGSEASPSESSDSPSPRPHGTSIGSILHAWARNPATLGLGLSLILAIGLAQIAGAVALIRRMDPVPGFSQPAMASPAVREVVAVLREEAVRRKEWPGGLSVAVNGEPEVFWRWILRGFKVKIDRSPLAAGMEEDVWIAPEGLEVPLKPEQWVGRLFPAIIEGAGAARPVEQRMVLWMRIPVP
ncbi:hypothetical protein [Thermoflexus sp.]|uniref:hypothetical protein n=1 Tax=Thermoflexus sp. TaxID=1969742 RepID=UPI0035E45CA8